MNVLMITQSVDADGWVLGFVHGWVEKLAARVERLDVLCLHEGRHSLPENVYVMSMGKEHGYERLRRLWASQRAIATCIRRADVVFSHMSPEYALIAAPWAVAFGVPVVQWYTHRHVSPQLRLAHALVDRVVTASPESFTLPSDKVTVIGHGIDMSAFQPAGRPPERLIGAVGRLSPIKHYGALIEAVARLDDPICVEIAGDATPENADYAEQIRGQIDAHGLDEQLTLLGAVPHHQIAELYHRAWATVNLCPTGGIDKAVLESMACGVPVLVRNEAFRHLLPDDRLWVPDLEPDRIAKRLRWLLEMSVEERHQIGMRLREAVQEEYSLDTLMVRLVGAFEQVTA